MTTNETQKTDTDGSVERPVRPLTDGERLDFLQWLTTRTEYQNQKRPTESVGSDMHIGDGRCSLYVRDLLGDVVGSGYSGSVRTTIDAVVSVLRPNLSYTTEMSNNKSKPQPSPRFQTPRPIYHDTSGTPPCNPT